LARRQVVLALKSFQVEILFHSEIISATPHASLHGTVPVSRMHRRSERAQKARGRHFSETTENWTWGEMIETGDFSVKGG